MSIIVEPGQGKAERTPFRVLRRRLDASIQELRHIFDELKNSGLGGGL